MLDTKYQDSRPYSFRQEDFFMIFPINAYIEHETPGRVIFGPSDMIWANLVEVH